MPGPGDYHVERPVKVPGGKFNVSDPKRFIDQILSTGRLPELPLRRRGGAVAALLRLHEPLWLKCEWLPWSWALVGPAL